MKKELKFKGVRLKNGIWTGWERPVMTNYHLECCDCGLVHTMNFRIGRVVKVYKNGKTAIEILPKSKYRVEFKVRRNAKYTKQERANKK